MRYFSILCAMALLLSCQNSGAVETGCEKQTIAASCNSAVPSSTQEIFDQHKLWLSDPKQGRKADLRALNLSQVNLDDVDLRYAEMADTNLTGACLRRANLSHANLNNAKLESASLQGATLTGALLDGVAASKVDMLGVDAVGLYARGANFTMATLAGSNFGSARFSLSNFSNASLVEAELDRADLVGANMTCADARQASLRQANLKSAKLENTNVVGASLHQSRFSPLTFPSARSMSSADGLGELLPNDDWAGLTEIASKLDDAGFRKQARMVRASATHSSLIAKLPDNQMSMDCFTKQYAAACLYFGFTWLAVGVTSGYRSDATMVLQSMLAVFATFFVFYLVVPIWRRTPSAVLFIKAEDRDLAAGCAAKPEAYVGLAGQKPLRTILEDFWVAFLVAGFMQLRFLSLGSLSAPSIFLGLSSQFSDVQLSGNFRKIGLLHALLSFYLITLLLMTIVPLPFLTGG